MSNMKQIHQQHLTQKPKCSCFDIRVLKLLCSLVDSSLPRRESENIGERTTLPKVAKRQLNLTIEILVDLLFNSPSLEMRNVSMWNKCNSEVIFFSMKFIHMFIYTLNSYISHCHWVTGKDFTPVPKQLVIHCSQCANALAVEDGEVRYQ